ncbi:MAG TPA: hypothetical protein VMR28_00685 [Candidatus Saccharimonadales bacterium]|nr:hypothetical protein [Candidatus Saccharimonadales bacterium]
MPPADNTNPTESTNGATSPLASSAAPLAGADPNQPQVFQPVSQPVAPGPLVSDFSSSPPTSPTGAVIGGGLPQSDSGMPTPSGTVTPTGSGSNKPPKNKKKRLIIIAAVVVVLAGALAAAYFGYYMNPNFIWKQSLGDTNIVYSKLVSDLNTENQSHYKGITENGSFNLQSGGTSYNGSLAIQSDGSNSSVSAKADIGVAKVDVEERGITAAGNSAPDIYLQVNGINNLNSYLGPSLGQAAASLNGKWIVVDHNLIIDLKNEMTKEQKTTSTPPLTWTDVNSFLQAAGKVNKQYLFTTNKKTAVTTVVKKYGRETVNGHDTYHYKIGFIPANTKAYVTAMCSALQQSDLGAYLKSVTNQDVGTSSTCKQLEASAGKIKSSDTVDVWADVNHRVIYKVRSYGTQNPAQNFVDIGLNYTGSSSVLPFFVSGQTKSGTNNTTFAVVATLNTNDQSVGVTVNVQTTGSDATKLSGNFSFKPTNTTLSLTPPQGAIPITTVLNQFGLGGTLTELQQLGSNEQLGSIQLKSPAAQPGAAALASLITTSLASGSPSIGG